MPTVSSSPSPVTPSAPATTAASPSAIAATIAEIQKLPVFVRLLNAVGEIPAKEGMGLQIGDVIRTQGQALAQINLNNGLAFRLGGDAMLTLQPDNRLNLSSGNMITWVQPGRKVPTEIVTPAAVAGIRGTTVFVDIPKNPKDGILFFAWEGSVSVRLPGATEAVLLKTAEEVRIKPGERDVSQIRQRVRRLSRSEWRQKRQTDRLLHGFKGQLSTLSIINTIKPGQASLTDPAPSDNGKDARLDDRRHSNDRPKDKSEKRNASAPKPVPPNQPKLANRFRLEGSKPEGRAHGHPPHRSPDGPAPKRPAPSLPPDHAPGDDRHRRHPQHDR